MAMQHIQCWHPEKATAKQVRLCIDDGHPVLIMMRGVPGSGKSFLARSLCTGPEGQIFSTDDCFYNTAGVYVFDPNKLEEYHKLNQNKVKNALFEGKKPVVVDNTNIFLVHMKPYINLALKYSYEIYFFEPDTPWRYKAGECFRRNSHGVTFEGILRMLENFEKPINFEAQIAPKKLVISCPFDDPITTAVFSAIAVSKRFPDSDANSDATESTTVTKFSMSENVIAESIIARPAAIPPSSTLFSLQPLATATLPGRECVSVGIQTSDVIGMLTVLDEDLPVAKEAVDIQAVTKELIITPFLPTYRSTKDRTTQTLTDFNQQITEQEVLLAAFPYDCVDTVLHLYDSYGMSDAVAILLESKAKLNINGYAIPNDPRVGKSGLSHSTREYSLEEGKRVESTSVRGNFSTDPGPLPYSGLLQQFSGHYAQNDELISQQFPVSYLPSPPAGEYFRNADEETNGFRLEMSSFTASVLEAAFGNGNPSDPALAYRSNAIDIPWELAAQLYQCWTGVYVPLGDSDGSTSISDSAISSCNIVADDFPSLNKPDAMGIVETENLYDDAALALQLHHDINGSTSLKKGGIGAAAKPKSPMTAAQLEQLKLLVLEFQHVDPARVKECYEDHSFSVDPTRQTLLYFSCPDDGQFSLDQRPTSSRTPPTAVPAAQKDSRSATPETEMTDLRNLSREELMKLAKERMTEAEALAKKRDSIFQRSQSYHRNRNLLGAGAATVYGQDGHELDRRYKAKLAEARRIVEYANRANSNDLDLHLLDVPSAIALLKQRLASMDRPPTQRRGKSNRKLQVITGYGKTSKGPAKLKPAIIQWLCQKSYTYSKVNDGVLEVECL